MDTRNFAACLSIYSPDL